MDVIKIAGTSRSTAAAGAIAGVVRDRGRVHVQAIGAGAVNQAVKAQAVVQAYGLKGPEVRRGGCAPQQHGQATAAIAREYLSLDGIDVICLPDLVELVIEGQERTALRITVEPC